MALRPIIAIFGTTGVGKSDFAVELALHLSKTSRPNGWSGARIINADSMQVYSGMDVITNKIPMKERRGIEHLLMDFKQPGEQYTINQWLDDAMKLIDETHQQKKIPIIVGGTSYWMQHLIFPNRLASRTFPPSAKLSESLQKVLNKLPKEPQLLYENLPIHPPPAATDPNAAHKLHELLKELDPEVAARWHWKDTRKVLRSLNIIKETGRRPSEIMENQSHKSPESEPRYDSLCFWLYAEPSVLERRLNDRVDAMVEGLLVEIQTLRAISNAHSNKDGRSGYDYTLGIYQAIGYKEFHHYLTSVAPTDEDLREAIERMKISTRQYAKRQISWIKNKLLPVVFASKTQERWPTPIFLLDATQLGANWIDNVIYPGLTTTEDFLAGKTPPEPESQSALAQILLTAGNKNKLPTENMLTHKKIICEFCTKTSNYPFLVEEGREWEAHANSRSHKYFVKNHTKVDEFFKTT